MADLGDRFLLMIIAATGLIVAVAGWAGGLITAEVEGSTDIALGLAVAVAFLLILGIFWLSFTRMDQKADDR